MDKKVYKKKGYYKMNKDWRLYLLEITVGHVMQSLHARDPKSTGALTKILMQYIKEESVKPLWQDNPAGFVEEATKGVKDLVDSFCQARLRKFLIDGMPKVHQPMAIPQLVKPINGNRPN